MTELCNFADDNSIYKCDKSIEIVMASLKQDLSIIIDWLSANQLVANPAKFQMMFLGISSVENLFTCLPNFELKPSNSVTLL